MNTSLSARSAAAFLVLGACILTVASVGVHSARAQVDTNTTCTLSAEPSLIAEGSSATLSWTTENADAFTVDQGIGALSPISGGTLGVTPGSTITYTGEAHGISGTTTCSTTVEVAPPMTQTPPDAGNDEPNTPPTAAPISAPASILLPPTPAPAVPASTAAPTSVGAPDPYPVSGTTPAPMIVDVGADGTALIRGMVESVTPNTMTVNTWGGTWIIRTTGLSTVIPASTEAGSLAGISAGDFVGVEGVVTSDQMYSVDAAFVRDWTTNPYVAEDASAAPPAVDGASTSSPDVEAEDETSMPTEPPIEGPPTL